jgi:predicted ATP-dependent endonuclease of OLD family
MIMETNNFRLQYIKIEDFKNIKSLELDFSDKDGITVLIGNNGCGKSNILEALSSIFAGLYLNRLHKPNFNYIIKYRINNNLVEITLNGSVYSFIINGKKLNKTEFSSHKEYLPKNVIACYSGESQRLWENYYWPYYKNYISTIKKSTSIPDLPMIYINRYNIEISLLTLFSYDFDVFDDVRKFCNNTLKIKNIVEITFYYNAKIIKEWNENSVIQMVKTLNNVEGNPILSADKVSLSLKEFKNKLSYLSHERELFKTLYAATMPKEDKIITGIELKLELNNGDIINSSELSEGEKKYLLMKVILETIADENSLLLFDEPDAHIHICRKAELKDLLDKYPNREKVLVTHSPTLAIKFEDKHIEGLCLDSNGYASKIDGDKAKLVAQLTNGLWNIQEQNIFLSSTKSITLLVEGKTDKIHIEEAFKHLKINFPNLDFDVFAMNGSDHIREVLIGLSCSEIQWNKKFIGIFDNDDAGIKDTKSGFEKETSNPKIKHVKYGDGQPSHSFYAVLLPKKTEFGDHAFTIENCYEPEKYQEAFKQAMAEKEGHFVGLSIDIIADDLKNKAKTLLAEQAKSFEMSEFEGFKPIFDLIEEIRKL